MKVYEVLTLAGLTFWLDRAKAEAAAAAPEDVREFALQDAPDSTWPIGEAVDFVSSWMRRTYLEELFARATSLTEAARFAGVGVRHLRRLLQNAGLSARQFTELARMRKLVAARAAIDAAISGESLASFPENRETP